MALLQTSILTTIFGLFLLPFFSNSFPLSTNSRWIIDEHSGKRVKLSCVNWAGHLHAMIPEGLNKKPLNDIVSGISSMGFNCVRLTWATYMYTRPMHKVATVSQSLSQWNLTEAINGVKKNNPKMLDMSIWDAHKSVVNALGTKKIMVVLDNHVSYPQWCCDSNDGNGFFGDQYFDPNEWVKGLEIVASLYKNPTVVAMSLRNELRGPHQDINSWYENMQRGAAAIHKQNPNLLIIFSGLKFASDLSFLKNKPLPSNLNNKLVFEAHWYAFGQPQDKWLHQTNEYCANATKSFMDNDGFLFTGDKNPVPLFLSEFGADRRGVNEVDNRYFICVLATLAEFDMDWGLWHLTGSFMLRQGQLDVDDVYAVYDHDWNNLRNVTFLEKLKPIQMKFQGKCIDISSKASEPKDGAVLATSCQNAKLMLYNNIGSSSPGPIQLYNTNQILTSIGRGRPVSAISSKSLGPNSKWTISKSKKQLAIKDEQGNNLCLDWDSIGLRIVTNNCLCLDKDLNDVSWCNDNPQSQWFKLAPSH